MPDLPTVTNISGSRWQKMSKIKYLFRYAVNPAIVRGSSLWKICWLIGLSHGTVFRKAGRVYSKAVGISTRKLRWVLLVELRKNSSFISCQPPPMGGKSITVSPSASWFSSLAWCPLTKITALTGVGISRFSKSRPTVVPDPSSRWKLLSSPGAYCLRLANRRIRILKLKPLLSVPTFRGGFPISLALQKISHFWIGTRLF